MSRSDDIAATADALVSYLAESGITLPAGTLAGILEEVKSLQLSISAVTCNSACGCSAEGLDDEE